MIRVWRRTLLYVLRNVCCVVRFSRAVRDLNETRASDVFVVNFGAYYEETPEGDETFKEIVFPMLDEMAEIGKTATVVWR